ncbi:9599_t:CDS:1 [Acaulospora morrowiae]|uniref:9599_t:CDS:1 n=1 Tax=Acaulospora morrowiae TaxID=94023 RepID=A0A9N9GT42_9GLOM|nr:9599_t:CDS:1 [Acaulospora morrowiae]
MGLILNLDIISEILNFLKYDQNSLHSCILLNTSWCKVAIPYLWKFVINDYYFQDANNKKSALITRTIISCMTPQARETLRYNGIQLPFYPKKPLFNYPKYWRKLSPLQIESMRRNILDNGEMKTRRQVADDGRLRTNQYLEILVEKELYKLFISSCPNIHHLILSKYSLIKFPCLTRCLEFLRIFEYGDMKNYVNESLFSSIYSVRFLELSEICHNVERLILRKYNRYLEDNRGLVKFIQSQRSLKFVELEYHEGVTDKRNQIATTWTSLVETALISKSSSITHLSFKNGFCIKPESFTNLKFLKVHGIKIWSTGLSNSCHFPNLEILHVFHDDITPFNTYIDIISRTGKTLRSIVLEAIFTFEPSEDFINYTRLITSKCPNLRFCSFFCTSDLMNVFPKDFEVFLETCKQLEGIILHLDDQVDQSRFFEILANKAPDTLKLLLIDCNDENWCFSSEALESFFENWASRHLGLLSIFFCNDDAFSNEEYDIFQKYVNRGVVKLGRIDDIDDIELLKEIEGTFEWA